MVKGIVANFSDRMKNKENSRKAQFGDKLDDKSGRDIDIDSLFEPDKEGPGIGDSDMMMDEKEKSPKVMKAEDHIKEMGLSVDEIESLIDCLKDKKHELASDDIDTEMDRDEAEMKDEMRKPLGDEAMGATSPGAANMMPGGGGAAMPPTPSAPTAY